MWVLVFGAGIVLLIGTVFTGAAGIFGKRRVLLIISIVGFLAGATLFIVGTTGYNNTHSAYVEAKHQEIQSIASQQGLTIYSINEVTTENGAETVVTVIGSGCTIDANYINGQIVLSARKPVILLTQDAVNTICTPPQG